MRLISFLGKGNYDETTYSFKKRTCRTRYVAHALASFFQPQEIRLIATAEAWEQHGKELKDILISIGFTNVEQVWIPTTGEPENLWAIFGKIIELIVPDGEILFDITHGFRAHPFFASSCIQYVQSVLPNPPSIRVVYGEYRPGENAISPIWELTPFLEVLEWSRNLMMFLRTGQADDVVEPTEALGRELGRQWAMSGRQGTAPQLRALADALRAFSDDFTTIRTGSLLIGTRATALRLHDTINQAEQEVARHLPALASILDQVRDMVAPLRTHGARLSSQAGQQALFALAQLYQRMGRYSEAISVLREGWITLGAPPDADHPGRSFSKEARENQEQSWKDSTKQSRTVSEMRNDIQHAGFNSQPNDRDWFEQQLTTLLSQWQEAIDKMDQPPQG